MKNRTAAHNSRLAKKRVRCLSEVLFFEPKLVFKDSIALQNPLLRQEQKREMKYNFRTYAERFATIFTQEN